MKRFVKLLLNFLAWLFLLPIFIVYFIQKQFTQSEKFYYGCAQFVSLFPGTLGNYIRKEYYKFTLKKCSDTCCICFGTVISHPGAEIGENVYIGLNCMIATVTIGDDTMIGSGVDILDGTKQHSFERLDVPMRLQERKVERVTIGRDCWLGNRSVIMANVGEGSVIGAGSVVTKDIEPFSVAVGYPARTVRKRNE
ncbi:MAG TPA: acyltransferase [Candidatus Omnitrophota bacterium]|nr:acyltransferase [Candidatus Omnitrophota bacterium]